MNKNIFAPKTESLCTLQQAVEYIAFDWEPLSEDYEDILTTPRKRFDWFGAEDEPEAVQYRQNIKQALGKLKLLLKAGLKFMATPYNKSSQRFVKEGNFFTLCEDWAKSVCCPYSIKIEKEAKVSDNPFKIEVEKGFDLVLHIYEQNHFITSFSEIFFIFSELKEALEDAEGVTKSYASPTISENNGYTTPFLTLINTMLQKGYVSADKQPIKKNLEEDIKKEAEILNIEISNRMCGYIATILRLPEMRKGGLKKLKGAS